MTRGSGRRSRAGSCPRHFAGSAAATALVLLLFGGQVLSQDNTFFANHPGRSLGVPACTGPVADASCFRSDDPSPPDACILRVRQISVRNPAAVPFRAHLP
jgi:hypothetical protein